MALTTAPPTAAHRVLTQQPLLALITSFQPGVFGFTRPLVLRFIGDGCVFCTNLPTRIRGEGVPHWYSAQLPRCPRLVTPLYKNVRPWSHWIDHVLPQAIAKYDDRDSLHILEIWLRHKHHSQRTRDQILHRVREAAASFGRVDLLTWLYEYQQQLHANLQQEHRCTTTTEREQQQRQRLVRLAVSHGHAHVLSWIETTYGLSSIAFVDRNTVWAAVHAGHTDALRWLAQRGLGQLWRHTDRIAVNRAHLPLLRFLREECPLDTFPRERLRQLMDRALERGHFAIVHYLFLVQQPPRRLFKKHTILRAIRLGHLKIASLLLEHRRVDVVFTEQDVRGWISENRVDVLTMLATVTRCQELGCSVLRYTQFSQLSSSVGHDTLRMLVALSLPEEIAMALVWTLLYNQDAAAVILSECTTTTSSSSASTSTHSGARLPENATAFARRVLETKEELRDEHEDETRVRTEPYYSWIMESLLVSSDSDSLRAYQARLARATVWELHAALLYLLWRRPDGDELPATLAYTSTKSVQVVVAGSCVSEALCGALSD